MILSTENLSISYGDNLVVDSLSFGINTGEIVLVCGSNGCGKSSLCLAVAGLICDDAKVEGKISIDGRDLASLSRSEKSQLIGIIFQNPETQLFSPTVEDELSFAPENLCLERGEIEKRIRYALEICDIEHLRKRQTNSLSGGEKQLVAIASVLTMKPKILIADEITSRIDAEGRVKIRNCIKNYAKSGSVLFVSHNKEDKQICDRVLNLDNMDKAARRLNNKTNASCALNLDKVDKISSKLIDNETCAKTLRVARVDEEFCDNKQSQAKAGSKTSDIFSSIGKTEKKTLAKPLIAYQGNCL